MNSQRGNRTLHTGERQTQRFDSKTLRTRKDGFDNRMSRAGRNCSHARTTEDIGLARRASWNHFTENLVFRYSEVSSEQAEICRNSARVMVLRIDGFRRRDLYLTG